MSLADVVTTRRVELGLSKAELSRRARITRSTLHEIENGTRKTIQPATANALAQAFGLDATRLRNVLAHELGHYQTALANASAAALTTFELTMLELLRDVIERLDAQCEYLSDLRDELGRAS